MNILKDKSNPMYGKKHTEETKRKIGLANKGKLKGIKFTEEHKKKISNKLQGDNNPMKRKELREKMSGSNNPMKRKEVVEKMINTSRERGRYQETSERLKKKCPMKDVEIAKKVGNTLKKLYSEGEIKPWNKNLTKENSEWAKRGSERMIKNNPMKKFELRKKQSATTQGIPLDKWERFIGRDPYDQGWTNQFKRAIRKRDNQICMACGIHREKLKRAFDVHHINYDKKMSIPQNCISLCKSCHMVTNLNRKHWINFFQSSLRKNYDYQYTQGGEIKINLGEQDVHTEG